MKENQFYDDDERLCITPLKTLRVRTYDVRVYMESKGVLHIDSHTAHTPVCRIYKRIWKR